MEIGFRTRFEERLNDLHSLNRKYADIASQNYSALRTTCNEYESLKGNHIEQKNKLSDESSLRKYAEITRTRAIETIDKMKEEIRKQKEVIRDQKTQIDK